MWFPATEFCRAPQHLLWAGPSARPGVRRVFMLVKDSRVSGVRAWQTEETSSKPANPAQHLARTLLSGAPCPRPFQVFQAWDMAARPFALLLADELAMATRGRPLVDLSWEAPPRVVTSNELDNARYAGLWQGGHARPAAWGEVETEWLVAGLRFAQEPHLADMFDSPLVTNSEHTARALEDNAPLEIGRPILPTHLQRL